MDASLSLVVIRVADLDRAQHFYETLGLRFSRERHGSGPEHLAAQLSGVVFEVYPQGTKPSTAGVRLGFRVPSVPRSVAALERLRAAVQTPPAESCWGLRAVVVDPDGHHVEIREGSDVVMIAQLTTALETNGVKDDLFRDMLQVEGWPIRGVSVPGYAAVECWRTVRRLVGKAKHWPVLIGNSDELDLHREIHEFQDESVEEILRSAARLDPANWIQQQVEANQRLLAEHGEAYQMPRGTWPSNAAPGTTFNIPMDNRSGRPFPDVWLLLVPTESSWEVPAFLKFGGFNSCPEPALHVAMLHRWNQEFGAELVGISHDRIELTVQRPPADRDSAVRLAEDQYVYCGDIVDQGVGTVEALAATVLKGTVWYFWWD
jgi:catechol 2,3-dioxygenase-like lactoylglutathione lyase family enzyme